MNSPSDAIAVVGMAGKFPGAKDIAQYWSNLVSGRESISRFQIEEIESRDSASRDGGPEYVGARAILEDAELFDSSFFGINPREADLMDPQHRLFLETCWNALENGGYDPSRYPGSIGVFGGCSLNTYLLSNLCTDRSAVDELAGSYQVGSFQTLLGNDKDFLATRVCYKLNLRGPGVTVQAACATSLIAICQASESLLGGQCDMALAGGVSVTFPQKRGYLYQEGGMASRDGHCRTFDADASGTVFGHGVGAVLLKRLKDAEADGDTISAVIRGFAINNDGSLKAGYMAPGVEGQARVIRAAHQAAGVSPETISYIEAHGTATPLGDPIEVAALTEAFRVGTAKNNFCAIGTVKTNIGHIEHAAGVAGVIKVALALRNRKLPASLHFRRPNPHINFSETPFYVNDRLRAWESEFPLRAGVSAFGVGGANAHIVMEEAPALHSSPSPREAELVCLSARSEEALRAATQNLTRHFEAEPSTSLADAAYTLHVGRKPFEHRAFTVAADVAGAQQSLKAFQVTSAKTVIRNQQVIFLFPGQGAQYPKMGESLYRSQHCYREHIDAGAEILRPLIGLDIRSVLYPDPGREDESARQIQATSLAQPALFVTEYALARLWMHWGFTPTAMAGHSVGELVAACLAGVMSFEDALFLIGTRGQLMQGLPQGAMLAVRLAEREVSPLLNGHLSLAAINAPELTVVAGPFTAIEHLERQLNSRDVAYRRLHTSHAFHSAMMDPIMETFADTVRRISLHEPSVRYLSCVTGTWIEAGQATDPNYWVRHFRNPVQFDAVAKELLRLPRAVFLEVGPGNTLCSLIRQQPEGRLSNAIASMASPGQENSSPSSHLDALGRLWLAGLAPNWERFYGQEKRRRVPLPNYPFERKRHWVEPPARESGVSKKAEGSKDINMIEATPDIPVSAATARTRQPELRNIASALFQDLSGIAVASYPPDSQFLEMGFDSLFLTQASLAIRRKFGVPVTIRQLMSEQSTLNGLVEYLDEQIPADQFIATPPAAPSPASVPSPSAGTTSSGSDSTAIDRVLKDQLDTMMRLMQQQMDLLRGSAPAIARELPPVVPPVNAQRRDSEEAAPVREFKAFGPYKPVQPGPRGGISERQQRALDALLSRYQERTRKSKQLTEVHRSALADPRVVSGFRSAWKEMVYPIATTRSRGSRLWDVDGNEYIDILNGFGAIFFGHSPEFVTEAVKEQLTLGVEIGPQTPLSGEVAELIRDLTGVERVSFCNTGSEAVIAALRVSRTVTGRDKFVLFAGAYHGTFDEVLIRQNPVSGETVAIAPGIPAASTSNAVVLDYGTPESLAWIETHIGELSAVLVEPVQSRNPQLQPRDFLHSIREITERGGAALIFDEVVTGFRVHPGGAQFMFDVRADMVTYGKVIGGGFPIGVVSGKAKFLDALDGGAWQYGDDSVPEAGVTFFAGTFVRHPLALAAAKAVLLKLKEAGPALQRELAEKTAAVANRIGAIFSEFGVPSQVRSFASWFYFTFPSDFRFGSLLYYHLRLRGVHIQEGFPCFLTTAHSAEDFDFVVEAFRSSVEEMHAGGFWPGSDVILSEPLLIPITESQKEIWLAAALSDEANCAFNESVTLRLRGPLQAGLLEQAIRLAAQRHESLRIAVSNEGSELSINPTTSFRLSTLEEATEETLAAVIADEGCLPFPLTTGPLFRATLLRFSSEDSALVFTAHHLAVDGWSANQLFEEIGHIYSGLVTGTPRSLQKVVPFSEYARTEAEKRENNTYAAIESYWVSKFEGRQPALDLPLDRPRPPLKSYEGGTVRVAVPAGLPQALRKASARQGCTMYAALLSAFQILLHRLSGQNEVVVGISAAGQSNFEQASLVGHCVHFLPTLSEIAEDTTAGEHLLETRRRLLDDFDHQEYTFGSLLKRITLKRDPSRLPLIEVQFNLEKVGAGLRFEALEADLDANPKAFVNTDLFLNVIESADGLVLDCDYNSGLLNRSTVQRWMNHYVSILESIASDSSTRISELPLLSARDREKILREWNETFVDFGKERCIHEWIEEQADRTPLREAVRCGQNSWTYKELDEASNRIARYLIGQGVKAGTLVGIFLDRSLEMLGAVLGIWKAGAAYVPLDPRHPVLRTMQSLEDSGAALVLTHERYATSLSSSVKVVCLDRNAEIFLRQSSEPIKVALNPSALAYVIYTSGSTGKPKGVAIEHRALENLLKSMERQPGLASEDVLVAVTTLAFDIAALELYLPLMVGARVVIALEEQAADGHQLLKLIQESKSTVLQATPATWRMLIDAGWMGDPKLRVLCGGEGLPLDLASDLLERSQDVWNMYGPTETTVWSSATRVEGSVGPLLIGPPIANTQFYVLDQHRQPLPVGLAGELYIGGTGLASGYWNRAELTAQKFIGSPFGQGRLYATGDLARWHENGKIELLGRTDYQVKIRGFRIELGEIESALNRQPEVRESVVVAVEFSPGDKRLVAYVGVNESGVRNKPNLTSQLRDRISVDLPSYMIPSKMVVLDALPRTPNGKIDRKQLPDPQIETSSLSREFIAPSTPEHRALAEIWGSVLKLNRVGITDSIFELGADSLQIFRISTLAGKAGMKIAPQDIFRFRTIDAILQGATASKLSQEPGRQSRPIVAAQRELYRRPLPTQGELTTPAAK